MTTALKGNGLTIRIRVGGLYLRDGHVLLVCHKKDGKSYWLLPGGGVEPGESLSTALERETFEECGVTTKTDRLLFVSEAISESFSRHVVHVTFLGQIVEGEPYLRERDARIVEVRWHSFEDLERLVLFPDFWPMLKSSISTGFVTPASYLGNLWRDE